MADDLSIELSVILPAYNEQAGVASAIQQYLAALPACCPSFELLVIDDGSADDTSATARRAAEGNPRVRVLRNEVNLGQVATILRGFREARGEVLTHNGIDLPFNPEETGTMLARIRGGADVVVVERVDRQVYGAFRKFVSWCNIVLVKVLFRSPFTDHNFVQAYRRRVLDAFAVESRGVSTVTPELILKSLAAGFSVVRMEAPYHRRSSGKSSVSIKKIMHTVGELLRLWRILGRNRRHRQAGIPNTLRK